MCTDNRFVIRRPDITAFIWGWCSPCAGGDDAIPAGVVPLHLLPIPERFTERSAPPVVTLTGPRPPGGVRVSGGVVHLRFVTDVGAVTAEVSESSPPPGNKPLVTVRRRRADGLPDVTVTEGLARVQILDEEV